MTTSLSKTDLQEKLDSKPHVSLGTFPTPLEEAPRLSQRLGVRVLLKRDDLTGLALGGNKVRKLEYLIADALAVGADSIVTTGGSQSNHARLAAAACRRTGLDCHLVLDRGAHPENQGNLLLDRLFGARVVLIDSAEPQAAVDGMEEVAAELRSQGRVPYVIPRGGSVPAGAIGYTAFVLELLFDLESRGLQPTHLYLGTGSTGTHAGTLAGCVALDAPFPVQGISVSRSTDLQVAKVRALANAVLLHLNINADVPVESVLVDDRFVGPGYGVPTAAAMEAIEIAAMDEAIVLDPVYTGKAMAGLIAHAREGRFGPDDVVVFVHTGGSPALFAYHRETIDALGARSA